MFSEKPDELLADLAFHGIRHDHISRLLMDGMHSFEEAVSGDEINTSGCEARASCDGSDVTDPVVAGS